MNMIKKMFAVVLCVLMLASFTTASFASAEEVAAPAGVRWFPCPENRQNDDAWEVQCVDEGCGCQRFTETAADTGYDNFLDTVYTAEGGLTITRNGNDKKEGNHWPRIRTIGLETSPELDLKTADTFYFDFTAAEGTQWNILVSINGMSIKLSKIISDACGMTGVANSDADGNSGTFKGSFNIWTAIDEIAKESGTESAVNAQALKNMKKTFVPQIHIFCVGPVGASVTLNEMFISTAADTTGANCSYVDMGLLTGLGDEYYEIAAEDEAPADDQPAAEGEGPAGDETPSVDETPAEDETEDTTKATTTTKKADKAEGGSVMPLIIIIVAVVVVVAVAVVIVLKKKKA